MCLSTGLFLGPVSPGARALEALKLQPLAGTSSLLLELSPRAHSQACPVTTQPSCRSLNIIFLQKVFNRTATVTTLQIPGDGYLYLFVLLNFILPLRQYLTRRVSIIEPFHTQNTWRPFYTMASSAPQLLVSRPLCGTSQNKSWLAR